MSYRVCIPTAGTGFGGSLTGFINKSLVSIANRPALSHLIEQFPKDAEFVIALGHGHLVREFLELATQRHLLRICDPFEGPGSGLGLSLLSYITFAAPSTACDWARPFRADEAGWVTLRTELQPYRT